MGTVIQAALLDELPPDCRSSLEQAWRRLGRTGDGSAYRGASAPVSSTSEHGVPFVELGDGELFVPDPAAKDDPGTDWKVFGCGAGVLSLGVSIIGAVGARGSGEPNSALVIGVGGIVVGVLLFRHGRHRQMHPPERSALGVYFLSTGVLTNRADVWQFLPRALARRAEHKRTGDVSSPAHTIVWYEDEFGEPHWVSLGNQNLLDLFERWRSARAG